jgi:hypothetical protein
MIMKKYTVDIILITCFVGIGALLLAGCYKDKGNYTYNELEQFYIDSTKVGNAFIVGPFPFHYSRNNTILSLRLPILSPAAVQLPGIP